MINKNDFIELGRLILSNPAVVLPKMIEYKSQIQTEVLDIASFQELCDVRDSCINEGLIEKLVSLASAKYKLSPDDVSLYCAAMAVGTIIKEYEWGIQFVCGDGLYNLATRIYNA